MPSLAALREHSVSSLFEAAVNDGRSVSHMDESDEILEVEDTEEPMTVDESEITVEYSEMMDIVDPAASVVSTVTNARRKEARLASQFGQQVMENRFSADELLDVDSIIRNCIHSAMTMIKDKDSCRGRKTSRLQLLLSLVPPENSAQSGTEYMCNCIHLMLVKTICITVCIFTACRKAMQAKLRNLNRKSTIGFPLSHGPSRASPLTSLKLGLDT